MSRRLTILIAFGVLAVPAIAATAEAAPSPPQPGGKYVGKSFTGNGKRIVVKVPARNGGNGLHGVVRYPCAGVSARFRSDDGTFLARKRRGGKTIFKARGSFRRMNVARGSIVRLNRNLRHGRCRDAGFKTVLSNAPSVHKATVTYGPFPTMPSMGHGAGGNFSRANLAKPCEDCPLVGMVPELREADGSRANFDTGAMLHHVVFFNHSADDATCSRWSERFFASGNERTPTVLPRGYGYDVSAGDDWSLITHLMNMSDQPKDLSIEVAFYYVKDAAALTGVKPFWLDINNCGNSEYETPAGVHTEARDFTVSPAMAGRLVAIASARIDLRFIPGGTCRRPGTATRRARSEARSQCRGRSPG